MGAAASQSVVLRTGAPCTGVHLQGAEALAPWPSAALGMVIPTLEGGCVLGLMCSSCWFVDDTQHTSPVLGLSQLGHLRGGWPSFLLYLTYKVAFKICLLFEIML